MGTRQITIILALVVAFCFLVSIMAPTEVDAFGNPFKKIWRKLRKHEKRIDNLEEQIPALEDKVNEHETEISGLKQKDETVQDELADHEQRIITLEEDMGVLGDRVTDVEDSVAGHEETITDHEDRITTLENQGPPVIPPGGIQVYDSSGQDYLGKLATMAPGPDDLYIFNPTLEKFMSLTSISGGVSFAYDLYFEDDYCLGTPYVIANPYLFHFIFMHRGLGKYYAPTGLPRPINIRRKIINTSTTCHPELRSDTAMPVEAVTLPFTVPVGLPLVFE